MRCFDASITEHPIELSASLASLDFLPEIWFVLHPLPHGVNSCNADEMEKEHPPNDKIDIDAAWPEQLVHDVQSHLSQLSDPRPPRLLYAQRTTK